MSDTQASIEDRVIDFFAEIFRELFFNPFAAGIDSRLKRNKVERAVADAADAASQATTRFLLNERLRLDQVEALIDVYVALPDLLDLELIGNANSAPESITKHVLEQLGQSPFAGDDRLESVYRVTLHSVVQVLSLVGPVMVEWRKVGFAETFEVLKRVTDRLYRTSEQLHVLERSGLQAADARFELTYRDYLMQRFHRVEAGTVKMTTNLNVDLRELFVMPKVKPRKSPGGAKEEMTRVHWDIDVLMDLAAARVRFSPSEGLPRMKLEKETEQAGLPAVDLVSLGERWVIIGTPGSGKSTFLEWLQIQVAMVGVELVLAGRQAIPLLLRVRQLDPDRLPTGADLIATATASSDRAKLAPYEWMDRMMRQGRILFMLDGLDEIEPTQLRDRVIPWLTGLVERYPRCHYLISSRPSGYLTGTFEPLGFTESDLLDFDPDAIAAYTCHWCVAVRLARNEPEEEARREGEADGKAIVIGFRNHPYINDLARSPLMLSAICLVNWFEGGQLPADRAMLYRLCVEGLLHHWDQRRGIHSEYSLDEKLRVCRELAIAMQSDDRAEYESDQVLAIFQEVLGDTTRGGRLLEHIRYRTGLLIERRPAVFAFAHLTFQEYLAAQAVHEGNRRGITMTSLIERHADPRWREVIPLFAGSGTDAAARQLIEGLMVADDSGLRGDLLSDAYLASERGLARDTALRERVLDVIAGSTTFSGPSELESFPENAATIANAWLGKRAGTSATQGVGHAFKWLERHNDAIDTNQLCVRLRDWRNVRNPALLSELVYLGYRFLRREELEPLSSDLDLYEQTGPDFLKVGLSYSCQGEIALFGVAERTYNSDEDAGPIFSEFPLHALLNALLAIEKHQPHSELLRFHHHSRWARMLTMLMSESKKRGLPASKIMEVLRESDDGYPNQSALWPCYLIPDIQALCEAMEQEDQQTNHGAAP